MSELIEAAEGLIVLGVAASILGKVGMMDKDKSKSKAKKTKDFEWD